MSRRPEQHAGARPARLAVALIGAALLATGAAAQASSDAAAAPAGSAASAAAAPARAPAPAGLSAARAARAPASAAPSVPASPAVPAAAPAQAPAAGTTAPASPGTPASAAVAAPAGPQSLACQTIGPICYKSSSASYERNRVALDDVDAVANTARGLVRFHADHAQATGPNLANSQWQFSGHVQVWMPQVRLQADGASVQFAGKGVASVTATGAPAQFEGVAPAALSGPATAGRRASGAEPAGARGAAGVNPLWHGHADSIFYDAAHDQLQLNGASWVSNGCDEVSGAHISYDIARQSLTAVGGGPGQPVQSTICRQPGAHGPGKPP